MTLRAAIPTLAGMEVHLNSEKEALLAQIAAQRGLKTDELAELVLSGCLEDDARFIEAVNLGLAAAGRGEFVEHEEVWANVERAEMDLAGENHFVLPPEAWAAFVKTVDAPPKIPAGLKHLFSRAPVAESR